jgi:hypothetical protein
MPLNSSLSLSACWPINIMSKSPIVLGTLGQNDLFPPHFWVKKSYRHFNFVLFKEALILFDAILFLILFQQSFLLSLVFVSFYY